MRNSRNTRQQVLGWMQERPLMLAREIATRVGITWQYLLRLAATDPILGAAWGACHVAKLNQAISRYEELLLTGGPCRQWNHNLASALHEIRKRASYVERWEKKWGRKLPGVIKPAPPIG